MGFCKNGWMTGEWIWVSVCEANALCPLPALDHIERANPWLHQEPEPNSQDRSLKSPHPIPTLQVLMLQESGQMHTLLRLWLFVSFCML